MLYDGRKTRSAYDDAVQGWVSLQHLLSSLQTKNKVKTYMETHHSEEFTKKIDEMYENFNNFTRSAITILGPTSLQLHYSKKYTKARSISQEKA